LRLLLLEDNDDSADVVATALTQIDPRYEILRARQLDDARRIVRTEPIDIALIDLTLPDASGRDAVRVGVRTVPFGISRRIASVRGGDT